MPSFAPELLIVLLLIVLNGAFAMSELAIVSSRRARLEQRAATGDRRARVALELAANPNDLLSTIQVGITLIGIINGAYGGATIAQAVSDSLRLVPVLAPYSGPLGFGLVVSIITYLSLVVGELVPKRLALSNPEAIAVIVAIPMQLLSRLARPVVRLLSASNDLVLGLLGYRPSAEDPVTEDEIRILIQQGTQAGVFQPAEQALVERVFKLADARVSELMTPRHEVVWLDADDPPEAVCRIITDDGHSRFPVGRGSLDEVLGVLRAKTLLAQGWSSSSAELLALLEPAVFVPETMDAFRVLEAFRQARTQLAIVVDEYGGTQGIVTVGNVLEAIVGTLPTDESSAGPPMRQLRDGAWSVDGMLPVEQLEEALGVEGLDAEARGAYRSLGGFVMARLGRVPAVGDSVQSSGMAFEVQAMDGKRVDRILVRRADPHPAPAPEDE